MEREEDLFHVRTCWSNSCTDPVMVCVQSLFVMCEFVLLLFLPSYLSVLPVLSCHTLTHCLFPHLSPLP